MIAYQNLSCRTGIWDACHNMEISMEIVMELLSNCTTIYLRSNEIQKANVVVSEMEEIEKDFTAAYETAWVYLKSRLDDTSSILPDSFRLTLKDGALSRTQIPIPTESNWILHQIGHFRR